MNAYVVTGASTGIGEACTIRLAARGATVFAGVRREADGDRLRARAGDNVRPILLDVTDATQVHAACDTVAARLGDRPLDGLVNNAGIGLGGPVEYVPIDTWREQFEVNVFGVVEAFQAFVDLLRRGPGRHVIVGSVSGRMSSPLVAPYAASKHAVEALAESLRHELYDWGIRTVLVEPGAVATPIWEKTREQADRLERELPAQAVERYRRLIDAARRAIERQATSGVAPERVAGVIERALLVSRPRPRYLVGADAHLQAAVVRFAPDRVRDALQRAVLSRL